MNMFQDSIVPLVREEELHAYVDGVLTTDRRAAVEAFLAFHPDEAERVEQYRTQNLWLHKAFDDQARVPLSSPLEELGHRLEAAGDRRGWARSAFKGLAMAASIALIFTAGWFGPSQVHRFWGEDGNIRISAFTKLAVEAHALATSETSPPLIEKGEESGNALVGWLSQRVAQTSRAAPDLAHFNLALTGGRIFLLDDRPVVHLVYGGTEHRNVSLFVGVNQDADKQDAFTFTQEGTLSTFYWRQEGMEFTLIGAMGRNELFMMAKAVHHQLRGKTPQRTTRSSSSRPVEGLFSQPIMDNGASAASAPVERAPLP